MKIVRVDRFGPPEVLRLAEAPDPSPGPGEIRIAVRAAGIGVSDALKRAGRMGGELPQTLGYEAAGLVDAIGAGVADVRLGDPVVGFSFDGAAQAELAVLAAWTAIPEGLGFAEAAALPASLETAARALDALRIPDGGSLVVNGATGGVGSAAVQLAIARGARVIGVAGPRSQDTIRGFGAVPVLYGDGLAPRLRALAPDGVDRALDVAGSGILALLVELVHGVDDVVTVADAEGAAELGVRFSRGDDGRALYVLGELGPLVTSGRLRPPEIATFPLADVADAHRVLEAGRSHPKLVLTVGRAAG